jgi:outer membrane murein-binding lipoprotein Lpp
MYELSILIRVSKLNKKLSLLKQQQQQLKIRVQAAREQAARDEAARKAALIADASILSPTLSSPPLYAKRRGEC